MRLALQGLTLYDNPPPFFSSHSRQNTRNHQNKRPPAERLGLVNEATVEGPFASAEPIYLLYAALTSSPDAGARQAAVAALLAFVEPADRPACWPHPTMAAMWEAQDETGLLEATGASTAAEVYHLAA